MNALLLAPAHVQLAALARGEISSEALVRATLERIAALDPQLNAIVALDAEAALAAARAADEARTRGESQGPLAGLPMTIKDSLEVAGLPAVCGVPALRDHRPSTDAAVVARVRAAGAIILGKTNVPAFAADFQTFNEVFGVTRNPHALDRTPGGSSGGAAAALAAGFTPLEIGTDLSGSLRLPAHACGVASLKPSHGVVPLAGSLGELPGRRRPRDLWVAGPMARWVADLELLFGLLAGPDARDAVAWRLDLPPPATHRPRIALWIKEAFCPPEPAVSNALRELAGQLEAAGVATVTEARPAFSAEAAFLTHCRLMYAEMAGGLPGDVWQYFERRRGRRGARGLPQGPGEMQDFMAAGLAQSHREWHEAAEERERLRAAWADFFTGFDAVLCPAAPAVAAPHDPRRLDQRTQPLGGRDLPALFHAFWASLANVTGLPAATVPAGMDAQALPIGAQLIGPWLGDRGLLALARRVEEVSGGFRPPRLENGRFRAVAGS